MADVLDAVHSFKDDRIKQKCIKAIDIVDRCLDLYGCVWRGDVDVRIDGGVCGVCLGLFVTLEQLNGQYMGWPRHPRLACARSELFRVS